ncbi:MAG: IS30 family transposase [Thermodesulfobacteriota bacterium]|jgi:IS30 family transposase|nr:MAG: IS30 family transposase [Thermodesulfobacteriota bacterium]WAC06848.1 MAG: IS30 family transposase [Thermodesulfobacteriota bacterium]WAC07578.1 MAG: IS30 family transposase [Thermodesulfobacteriota bacterium]WAC07989.1 MAG: IS30 family transposase [Thermodesulfobacteriota bacterium]WAC08216.1 MAG: IS30 family transposase [Thermodesulfobacteriota bacterium]
MSYIHLTENERYVISHLNVAGFSKREIARRINRDHSTVSRELKRNGPEYDCTVYWYDWTHPVALKRRHQARHYRREGNERLVDYVKTKLNLQWSPEEISDYMRINYPDDETMRVCHETIYRWIYKDAKVNGKLYLNLRRGRKRRRRQKRYGLGRRFLAGRKRIAQRPEIVEGRKRFGDWEGDTIEGKKSSGYIATLVERKSRYLLAGKLENKKATTLTDKSTQIFRRIPGIMRQTLTVDNGTEFAQFKELEEKTKLSIYFADPYAAWQRGANENTNGLLRQYFPKGTYMRKITERDISRAVKRLNNRPRKSLNYRTPYEVFWNAARGALAI